MTSEQEETRPLCAARDRAAKGPQITVSGGPAPVHAYVDELPPDVLEAAPNPAGFSTGSPF